MKRNIFIGLSLLVVVLSYGCTKKQTVSENSLTGAEVAAQNQDFSNRKPFQFTITTERKYDDEESGDASNIAVVHSL